MTLIYIALYVLSGLIGFALTYQFTKNEQWVDKINDDTSFRVGSLIAHILGGPFSLLAGIVHTII